jgi:hypothetical protein
MGSVTIWTRLEPRSRSDDLADALAARVHDPLWLLARQWQMGEFEGRDTGSPLTAQLQWTTAPFDRFASGADAPQRYDGSAPLEALIEREAVRPQRAADDLLQAVEAGLEFLRRLDAAGLGGLRAAYLGQYPLPSLPAWDVDGQRFGVIVSGRVPDGIQLRADLAKTPGSLPSLPALSGPEAQAVQPIAAAWSAWYDGLFSAPSAPSAAPLASWSPARMEYSFAVGAAADANGLVAQEYDGGAIDWYTFNRASTPLAGGSAQPVKGSRTIVVAPITFRGMPARRFWEMEDAAVDVGGLTAAAEDLGRLLLREFVLIYGNDWFQLPLAVPVGSQVRIDSLTVLDTFGISAVIPHYAAADGLSGGWRMFSLRSSGASIGTSASVLAAANLLVVPPAGLATLDSAPIEDVLLLRDEPAEMAWAVERKAVGFSGLVVDRGLAWRTTQPPVPPPGDGLTYRLGSIVPDYWLPLLPVAVDNGPLRLRRGQLPTASVGVLGKMLAYPDLTVFLEEVPREGVYLTRRYRYARGLDGAAYLWIGRQRSTGTGEGRSGLRFDYLDS